jgi:hypothetical protein
MSAVILEDGVRSEAIEDSDEPKSDGFSAIKKL